MIADLKPYPKYKESALPWLGKLPDHWAIERAKSRLTTIDRRSKSGREELLTVSSARGVVPRRTASVTMFKAKTYAGHKLCWPNDLVINSLWAWAGGLGVTSHHGIVSTAYSVYRPRSGAGLNPSFLHELVRSAAFQWELQVRSKGVWTSRLQLTDTAFLDARLPLPPPTEQAAIVRFLDWSNERLERTIRAKRKIIALLGEQKQAIIHRAVTRGLDHARPLKPSGIDWTPAIPQDWEQYPLRRLATCENSGSYGREPSAGLEELPVATTAQISRDGHFTVADMPRRGFTPAEVSRFCCRAGDILVVKSSGSAANVISGKCGIVEENTPPFVFSNFLARFIANRALVDPRYLHLLLTSYITRERVRRMVSTTTYPNLRMGEYRGAILPVPPLPEQERILESVGSEVASVEQASSRLEREIDLLREYRTRLVADVVTGKLDVRDAASHLPDQVQLSTIADDSDLIDEPGMAEDEAEE